MHTHIHIHAHTHAHTHTHAHLSPSFFLPVPPTPPPPPPPQPTECKTGFTVKGAGNETVNGFYKRTNQTADNAPVFALDKTHQLYRTAGTWRLAHEEVEVFYDAKTTTSLALPPPTGWYPSTGLLPSPESVVCGDE
eukprot:m.112978 g.112978  ORF g.112978 m.112978 type:complete len:136 (+) comp22851_c0_seq6:441-848(+)